MIEDYKCASKYWTNYLFDTWQISLRLELLVGKTNLESMKNYELLDTLFMLPIYWWGYKLNRQNWTNDCSKFSSNWLVWVLLIEINPSTTHRKRQLSLGEIGINLTSHLANHSINYKHVVIFSNNQNINTIGDKEAQF